ncbi:MAG: CHASE4 domain-containing protein [Anaerolineae bacterium]
MSLRRKTQIILALALIILVLAFVLISQQALAVSYAQFESTTMRSDLNRLSTTLESDVAGLVTINRDYAWWDDTYQFVSDFNLDYRMNNQSEATYENLDIDMMLYFDLDRHLIFSRAYGPVMEGRGIADIEAEILRYPELFQIDDMLGSASGLITLFGHPMMVSTSNILTSNHDQAAHAIVLFGRILTDERIESLSNLLNLDVGLTVRDDVGGDTELQNALNNLSSSTPIYVREIDEHTVSGYTLLNDVNGQSFLLASIHSSRDSYQQGRALTNVYVASISLAAVLFFVLIMTLLEFIVMRPLTRLTHGVKQIAEGSVEEKRLPAIGKDELGQLSTNINHMLDSLEKSQAAVSQANARLSAIVGSAPLALWVVDETGSITLFEGRGREALHIKSEDAIGKPYTSVFLTYPQFTEEIRRALNGETIESTVPVRDFVFDTRYTPLGTNGKTAPGKRSSVLVVALDVTDRTRAAEEVKSMLKDVDTQILELRRLRSFATSSLAFVQTMVEQQADSKDILEYLKTALRRMEEALNE